jgi:hypothetical protein
MKTANSRCRIAVAAVLFSTAVVLAGCGSDHKVTKTTTTTEETTTAPSSSPGSSSSSTTTTIRENR